MTSAFLYLTWCSVRNRTRVRLRRLREPRYLIGALVGGFYFYFVLYARPTSSNRAPSGLLSVFERFRGTVELGGSVAVFAMTALAWVLPRSGAVLGFTQSEVQFLFTAPVSRAELIRFKVIRSQLGVLIGSALMTLFFRPTSLAHGWMFFFGMALVMTVINLHFMGVALRRQSLAQHGGAGVARQWMPLAIVVLAVVVLIATVVADWTRLSALTDAGAVVGELQRLSQSGAAAAVLWPFRALVRLALAASPGDFFRALPAGILFLFLNYLWVVRSDAAFEEASAQAAEKMAARVSQGRSAIAPRVRHTRTPFPLALEGRAETAILWKNLILLSRYASLTLLLRIVPAAIVIGFLMARGSEGAGMAAVVAGVGVWIAGVTVLLGPQMARNDLRQDLTQLAVLKTWPVRGAALIRGEVAGPVVVLTVVTWTALLTAAIFASVLPASTLDWSGGDLAAAAVAAALVAPGVIAAQVLAHNAIAVMFPAWVAIGSTSSRGVDVMGQRMVMMAGMLFVVALAMLPAAIAAGLVGYALFIATGTMLLVVPAIVAAVVLAIECAIASEALGSALDRTDVSAVAPVEG